MDNNLVGKTIQGRYHVVKQLGRGGVGITFLARDQQCFGSPCVVKQLKPKSANAKTLAIARRLFNREAEIMNRLGDCDRIPRLLAYFEQDHDFFLVQELIEGQDLSHEIVTGQPWSVKKSIALLQDILEVLLFVQQSNVIHRDLKPSNLMRRAQDNKIVLIDFGSVKQISSQISTGSAENVTIAVGTRSYMPMEQMTGRPGFYSDIYAVGIIVIQALTGIHPQKLNTDNDGAIIWRNQLQRQARDQPHFLDILDKMVHRNHQDRYASAETVLADLEQLDTLSNNKHLPITTATPARQETPPQPSSTSAAASTTKIINSPAIQSSTLKNFKAEQFRVKAKAKSKHLARYLNSKTVMAIALMLTLLGGLVGSKTLWRQKTAEEIKLTLYESTDQNFKVNYPEAWSQQNQNDFFASGVFLFSPLASESDQFKERVSIFVENLPDDTSLAQYTQTSIAEIKKLSDPNVTQAKVASLNKREARQITYRGEENGQAVQRMQTWSIKDNQAYVITYTALPADYHIYLPTVQKIIKSFVITK